MNLCRFYERIVKENRVPTVSVGIRVTIGKFLVSDAIEIGLVVVGDDGKLALGGSDACLHRVGPLPVLGAVLAAGRGDGIFLGVAGLKGIPFGQGILDVHAISLHDFQKTLGPYLSQTLCSLEVGMEEELARVAVFLGEQHLVVLEELPYAAIAGKDLVVLLDDGIDDGIVAVQAVETFLQVHGAIIGVRAVPDGIVQQNLAVGHTRNEGINDGLDVFTVCGRRDRSPLCCRAGAVVGAEHNREIDEAAIAIFVGLGCCQHAGEVIATGQEA